MRAFCFCCYSMIPRKVASAGFFWPSSHRSDGRPYKKSPKWNLIPCPCPTSCYYPYKWPYKWVAGVISPLNWWSYGPLLTTGRDPSLGNSSTTKRRKLLIFLSSVWGSRVNSWKKLICHEENKKHLANFCWHKGKIVDVLFGCMEKSLFWHQTLICQIFP